MNILILGSGGREHALFWRLAQDESAQKIYAWPGNPGMALLPGKEREKYHAVSVAFSKENLRDIIELYHIQLVIPGAEKYLYDGVADWCEEWNVACFGPGRAAASLERSKLFSKNLMVEASVPTAHYKDLTLAFNGRPQRLENLLSTFTRPVIKISGPSLGKGVFVCRDVPEAKEVLEKLKAQGLPGLEEGIFVEEAVTGKEVSLFYACNGDAFTYLGAAQDHKRLRDNDEGPNTGGMGAISPVEWANDRFTKLIEERFVKPTLAAMKRKGCPFKGMLFLGLMVNAQEIMLLEYNVSFGDPETQVILPLIEGDFTRFLYDVSRGAKAPAPVKLKDAWAVHVVKAAQGYPGLFGETVEKGREISLEEEPVVDTNVFFAGVRKEGGKLLTSGGRVLGVTAIARNKDDARTKAYDGLKVASFQGQHFRGDIGLNL